MFSFIHCRACTKRFRAKLYIKTKVMKQYYQILLIIFITCLINALPVFSQTGEEEIAYATSAGIRVMNADGSGDRLLIEKGDALAIGNPVWSTNGDKIAFIALISATRSLLYVADYDGRNPKIAGIADVNGTSFSSTIIGQVSWSSNDRYISFATISLDFSSFSVSLVHITDLYNNTIVRSIAGYAAAQFEPVPGSLKIAMSGINPATARDFIGTNDLSLSNGETRWWTLNLPNDFKNVAWLNRSTLYTVINNNELYYYKRTGNNIDYDQVAFVNSNERISIPSISDNGKHMVFSITRANGNNELFTAEINSRGHISNTRRIGFGSAPSWRKKITTPVKKVVVKNQELKVFPNPARDVCTVNLELKKATTAAIKVINTLGQTVLSQEIDHTNFISTQLDVSGLQAGKYIILIETEDFIYSNHLMKI